MALRGVTEVRVEEDGSLYLETPGENVRDEAPLAYQTAQTGVAYPAYS